MEAIKVKERELYIKNKYFHALNYYIKKKGVLNLLYEKQMKKLNLKLKRKYLYVRKDVH
jgi:hypothetical protein